MSFKEKWEKSWNFEKKMNVVIVWTIAAITIAAIVVSTFSFVMSITKQNSQYVTDQLTIMAQDCANNLEQYKSLITACSMDSHVQEYCESTSMEGLYGEMGNVYNSFLNMLYMQYNANFIAVINTGMNNYLYNGNVNINESFFEKFCEEDYKKSMTAKTKGALKVSFSNRYHNSRKYTLTLYFPVYSVTKMVNSRGLLVVNLDDDLLKRFHQKESPYSSNLYLTDVEGNIVSTQDESQIGNRIAFAEQITGDQGRFWHGGMLISYQRVGGWNFYMINEVEALSLYRGCFGTILILLAVMLVVTGTALALARNMTKKLFSPINKIVSNMNDVSRGNLRTRIHVEDMDSDGRKLADGFNIMMDEIDVLMEQVKEEQRQFDKMHLYALQSQIQPHFLYNTLECIHWQALSEGNKEISTMVKAMAQYYRICLSEGKDIITLETELAHVRNYLIIQNMRYDNIIAFTVKVPEEYFSIRIPKLTLQPLVENSIYHGIRVKEGKKGTIEIAIREAQEDICLTVKDDGVGMVKEQLAVINQNISNHNWDVGYGISNINKRIELMFGEEYGLTFRANEESGICVEIRLPKEWQEEPDRGYEGEV
ncbi:sensor histidine kinase [Parablautia intestinalis]|nr:histidine kinase [Parablautia intestinalis]